MHEHLKMPPKIILFDNRINTAAGKKIVCTVSCYEIDRPLSLARNNFGYQFILAISQMWFVPGLFGLFSDRNSLYFGRY